MVAHFAAQRLALHLDFVAPMESFDDLLGAERQQHTDDHDADLAQKLRPAVDWMRMMMNFHRLGPRLVPGARVDRSLDWGVFARAFGHPRLPGGETRTS